MHPQKRYIIDQVKNYERTYVEISYIIEWIYRVSLNFQFMLSLYFEMS